MAKSPSIEELVLALTKVRADPTSRATRDALAEAVAGKSNHVAAKGATLASELGIAGLLPNLEKAFPRFFADGADKGCVAKQAIADALERFESVDEALFLRGVRHEQTEPVWGGSSDVAVGLRATCARALSRLNTRSTLPALTDLLGDAQPAARAAAAQAIGHCGRPEGALPLRLKIRVGDDEPAVMGECFAALLKLIGEDAVPLVAPFLATPGGDLCEPAAVALGESHLAGAYALLRERFAKEITVDGRRSLLFGIALSRRPDALELLLTVIDDEPAPTAAHAVESLAMYRNDSAVTTRIRALVDARRDATLTAVFTKHFGRG